MADLILPVHETLIRCDYSYQPNDGARQGYRAFVSNIRAKEKVIWNGYDISVWKPRDVERKKGSFLTVGAGLGSRFGYQLKGIDLFAGLAQEFPECAFTIVGGKGFSPSALPANVKVIGEVANADLPELYSRHEYYVQLSMSEGFPNALTEAILCGCCPIVSGVGAMPMIVQNDERVILKRKDPQLLHKLVLELLKDGPGKDHLQFARTHFNIERRSRALPESIEDIISSK
jgi:glycosyltransferase involved in cell wall biosynthesis